MFSYFSCSNQINSNVNEQQNVLPDDWITIKNNKLAFSIPGNMSKQDIYGRDSLFLKYSNEEMSVSFELGIGIASLNNLEKADYIKKYEKKEVLNQHLKGVQMDYQFFNDKTNFADKNKTFGKAISFDCERESRSITFIILFTHPESNDIAEKIIKSILFDCS
jgi:hypothetical protein